MCAPTMCGAVDLQMFQRHPPAAAITLQLSCVLRQRTYVLHILPPV
jgi:hypothetical protein